MSLPANQTPSPSLLERSRSLPLATRIIGIAAVVVLLAAAIYGNRPASGAGKVSLLGDIRLQELELQRMQVALSRAGIVDTEIRGPQLWLQRDRLSAALKAISDQGLLPANLTVSKPAAPEVSPFVSRYQQQLQQQHQKKLAIQSLVERLGFVAEASLEVDFGDAAGVSPGNPLAGLPVRCTITVRPVENQFLELGQLETIRQIALGSLSQLSPANLVIVDLAAGIAYDEQLLNSNPSAQQTVEIEELRYRQRLDREIRRALADLAEVEVRIVCRKSDAANWTFAPGSIASAQPAQNQSAGDRPHRERVVSAQLNLPGTNGMASISGMALPGSAAPATLPSSFSQTSGASEPDPQPFLPQVTIRLLSAKSSPEKTASLAEAMEREQLRNEILRRVRPLLPESSLSLADGEPVVVKFLTNEVTGVASSQINPNWKALISGPQSGIWLAVLSTGGLGVLLLFALRRKSPGSDCPATPQAFSQAEEGREQELKEQIDELLRTHPDTAANVIREWIQKAA